MRSSPEVNVGRRPEGGVQAVAGGSAAEILREGGRGGVERGRGVVDWVVKDHVLFACSNSR